MTYSSQTISFKTVLFIFFCVSIGAFMACGDEEPLTPTAREEAFEKLARAWTMETAGSGIFLDGQDVSLNYPGFSLSFADGTYQTANAGDLFSASGTWQFTDEQAQKIQLDSGEEVTIQELSLSKLEFSFVSDGTGGSAAGIGGSYQIILGK